MDATRNDTSSLSLNLFGPDEWLMSMGLSDPPVPTRNDTSSLSLNLFEPPPIRGDSSSLSMNLGIGNFADWNVDEAQHAEREKTEQMLIFEHAKMLQAEAEKESTAAAAASNGGVPYAAGSAFKRKGAATARPKKRGRKASTGGGGGGGSSTGKSPTSNANAKATGSAAGTAKPKSKANSSTPTTTKQRTPSSSSSSGGGGGGSKPKTKSKPKARTKGETKPKPKSKAASKGSTALTSAASMAANQASAEHFALAALRMASVYADNEPNAAATAAVASALALEGRVVKTEASAAAVNLHYAHHFSGAFPGARTAPTQGAMSSHSLTLEDRVGGGGAGAGVVHVPKAKRGRPQGEKLHGDAKTKSGADGDHPAEWGTDPRPPTAGDVAHAISATATKHICDVCNKTFVSVSKLARHKVVHSKVKAWACQGCGTSFSQKSALTVHLKRRSNSAKCNQVKAKEIRLKKEGQSESN